ncbi:MAG TPA: KTSC domain-containing protein [Verrucomicrobiae bacterium]|jgi:hypothetical protein|nr:KTSC domain-containing protein [Verrucomicrobiae bacterium]
MERTAVRSSDIALVGYDVQKSVLEVAFRRGGVYHYEGVPSDIHERLLQSSSVGTYFRDCIKEKYPYRKVS